AVLPGPADVVEDREQLGQHSGRSLLPDGGSVTLYPFAVVGVLRLNPLQISGALGELGGDVTALRPRWGRLRGRRLLGAGRGPCLTGLRIDLSVVADHRLLIGPVLTRVHRITPPRLRGRVTGPAWAGPRRRSRPRRRPHRPCPRSRHRSGPRCRRSAAPAAERRSPNPSSG